VIVAVLAGAAQHSSGSAPQRPAAGRAEAAIRVNQLGYLPAGPKVAVFCSTDDRTVGSFEVFDAGTGARVFGPAPAEAGGTFGPCRTTYRLDFGRLAREGSYRVRAGDVTSQPVRIARDAYGGAADFLLNYMRQQRSLFNPVLRDSVHVHTDGILVDHPERAGEFIPVAGGWADAADYLQYVATSAHATYSLLLAWRDHPQAFGDVYAANGLPGANGLPDVLDEARWGLEWLLRMYPEDSLVLNQLGDDRDHAFLDLPNTDSSDYGWGRGGFRPVYPCTGEPQGLLAHRNRSTGKASTAGKFASAFALGSMTFARKDPAFAAVLAEKAPLAYEQGRRHPGLCQTAPAGAPYFYEEENWADDMELAAAALHALTRRPDYLRSAADYAAREPVTPWMGKDTARHYEWFPWHNNGHYELWRAGEAHRAVTAEYYRRGLAAVAARANNGFRVGVPFIWCSNNLMASLATHARLYRTMTGDTTFVAMEAAAVDWLFGANPWGVSMVIGLPANGVTPKDPHSVMAQQLGVHTQNGGLVDGPVYRSIFENLRWVQLYQPDEYAQWNTGHIVYHDDWGDYSTNEPIMDGTANLVYVLAALAGGEW
jgi:hypothetical protein